MQLKQFLRVFVNILLLIEDISDLFIKTPFFFFGHYEIWQKRGNLERKPRISIELFLSRIEPRSKISVQ